MAITLTVGQLVLENIVNKKNRSNSLDKLISGLQKKVKENPGHFLEKSTIQNYKNFIESSPSVIKSADIAPVILTKLILERGHLPTISRVVDSMNLVSIETGLTMSMWDRDQLVGPIVYKLSGGGEKYWPFMGEEVNLLTGELAAFDKEKVLCLVRYRDSKYAPVTLESANIVLHIQGVNGITEADIQPALNQMQELLISQVGGQIIDKNIMVHSI